MNLKRYHKRALRALSKIIIDKFPETIGLGVARLNCGCLLTCSFNVEGWQSGPTAMIPSHPSRDGAPPICRTCFSEMEHPESRRKRVRNQELFWPGGAPSEQVEEKIYLRVFGETPKGELWH